MSDDTELLDFLEREGACVFYRGKINHGWTVQVNWGTGHLIQPTRPTLREAIEAAMDDQKEWKANGR